MPHAAGLYYETHGHADAPPLILSSGLGGSASYWKPNIPTLAEHFHVIAYDHRGTGRSDRALPERHSISDMADDALIVMDDLGLRQAHFMGHALGGIIGLAVAIQAPERLDRVVVVNGWAKLDPMTARCFDVRLDILRDSGPEAFIRAQPLFLYPADWISVHDAALNIEAQHQLADFSGVENVERRVAALRAWNPGNALRAVTNPVLVLATSDDLLVPSHTARDLCDLLPHHTRMLQFHGGHAASVTEPEDFHDRVLPWLKGDESIEE
jgi:aminoacrylate hydrolase